MGKVLKAVAIVALVAVIVFAPQVGLPILAQMVGSALIASAILTAVVIGASYALSRLTAAKPSALATKPPAYPSPQGFVAIMPFAAESRCRLPEKAMTPVQEPGWRRWFDWGNLRFTGRGRRFYLARFRGGCLEPRVPDGAWAVIDRRAMIAKGDLFAFSTRDLRSAYPAIGLGAVDALGGVAKRFVGADPVEGYFECECDRPKLVLQCGLGNVIFAHKIVATAGTLAEARRELRRLRSANRAETPRPLAASDRIAAP